MTHCELFQTDEIQVVVGDASRNGVGGQQYCGIWSLTSKHRQFNAFGNSFAGLIPGEIRGKSPILECVDSSTTVLSRTADESYPVDVRAEYQVKAPYYVEHNFTFRDKEDVRKEGCNFREVSWCSYMNCPDDSHLYFLSSGEWFRYISPKHGVGSNIAPSYISERDLEVFPHPPRFDSKGNVVKPFYFCWDRIKKRFDKPFYYGRLENMVLILIFDTPRWLRFFCSPSGGGASLLQSRTCPAWDFEWIIPNTEYEVGREYSLRMRMVYKKYISDEDVLIEYRKTQKDLQFESIKHSD